MGVRSKDAVGLVHMIGIMESDVNSPRPRTVACWLLIAGLVFRLFHYLANYTIWYDESVLLFNVLDKDYARLVGKLDYAVAAPPLFVWILRFISETIGDIPYVWRALPFVVGCALLILTYRFAARFLTPIAGATLVGMVAFSDAHVWLGCNIKPYILDAFCGMLLIHVYFATQMQTLAKRLMWFAILAVPIMIVSYPGIFLFASVLLAFLPDIWRSRRIDALAMYALLAAIVLGTFACLYFGPMHDQRGAGLMAEWANKFPDFSKPVKAAGWVIGNTFLVWHFCYNPIGGLCIGVALFGLVRCIREGRLDLVLLLVSPLALALVAACIKAYPYSNNRLILFLAPSLGVWIALGIQPSIEWLLRRTRPAVVLLVSMILVPEAAYSVFHVMKPWQRPDSSSTARYIRTHRQAGDLVATNEATYKYFFLGELRSLNDVKLLAAGQRIWVPMDHYDNQRQALVQAELVPEQWELLEVQEFYRTSAFLLQRKR